MTKRDLFRIIIKIIGLYFILQIPMNMFNLVHAVHNARFPGDDDWHGYLEILFIFVMSLMIAALFTLLILKSDKVIDLFRLDKNFDSDKVAILGNITSRGLLKIGIILLAGISFIDNIAPAITSSFYIFRQSVANPYDYTGYAPSNYDYFFLTQNIVCVIISLILMFNSTKLAEYLLTGEANSALN